MLNFLRTMTIMKPIDKAEEGGWYQYIASWRAQSIRKERSFSFDLWFAIKTLWIILEELGLMYIPIINIWRLNERHYGAHQKT
jgi:bisphosphoglycerate-dependent phosphoglycerate mutase